MLVLFSGLAGVGKSTLANEVGRQLGAVVLGVDVIEAALLRAGLVQSFETGLAAYEAAASLAEAQLRLGHVVIGDAVNALEVGRDIWRAAARAAGSAVCVVVVGCSDAALHQSRLGSRQRGLGVFREPSWDDVERGRAEFERWREPTLSIDTAQPVESCAALVVEYVRAATNRW